MISVILPVYNQEKYILHCINSILKQQYKDIEIIIVDDGSTDRSAEICKKIAKERHNIVYFFQKNQGVSSARNRGIALAKGDWIAFIDPDDYIKKEYFFTLVNNIDNECDIVATGCYVLNNEKVSKQTFFDTNINAAVLSEKIPFFCKLMYERFQKERKAFTDIGVPWGKLYRTEFLREKEIFFNEKLLRMQDNIFNMYAFFYARRIKYINELTYVYRYEHIDNWLRLYKPYQYRNFKEFCRERIKFITTKKDLCSQEMLSTMIKECIAIYIDVFLNEMRRKNISLQKKYSIIRRICNDDNLNTVLRYDCDIRWEITTHKLVYYLLKQKKFKLLFVLIVLRSLKR